MNKKILVSLSVVAALAVLVLVSNVTMTTATTTYNLTVTKAGTGHGVVTSSPAGINCGATCSASYSAGTIVSLFATPGSDSTFSGWSGACSGMGSCSVTMNGAMNGAKNVIATFTAKIPSYSLVVFKSGTGKGTVTSTPHGINCGRSCFADYTQGTVVTLTATPNARSVFSGWAGACSGMGSCTITMDAAKSVTATFTSNLYSLRAFKSGTGGGLITSNPPGIDCGGTCLANFLSGTIVTVTASADGVSAFSGWTGDCSGTDGCSITMTTAKSVTATFTWKRYDLTVTKAGTGYGVVTSAPGGINCGATCSASFNASTTVRLFATPGNDSVFSGWSGPCSLLGSVCTVAMDAAKSVTATFNRQITPPPEIPCNLTVTKAGTGYGVVTSAPGGINCGATCSASYSAGTIVSLFATPGNDSVFSGWSGDCSGTGSCNVTCNLTMNGAKNVIATFTAKIPSYPLTVFKSGTGKGTVTSTPHGINCGRSCFADYTQGTVVTLTATPNAKSVFSGWAGACSGMGSCTITMDAAKSVTATFTSNLYSLRAFKSGTGGGLITSNPPGIDCGGTCLANFLSGTIVTVTASADGVSAFSGWTGDCSGTGGCSITMTTAKSVTATFNRR